MTCGLAAANAPVVTLILVGSGESLMRLEKHLSCAAAGLGLAVDLSIRKDADGLGIPFAQTPTVLVDGQVALTGLPRTEEIEAWLRQSFPSGNKP